MTGRTLIQERLKDSQHLLDLTSAFRLRGVVTRVADDVAWVSGLLGAGNEDVVRFDSGALGIALELGNEATGVALLSRATSISTGEAVEPLGRPPYLPVGFDTLGRALNPLGAPLDGGPPVVGADRELFRPALAFVERADVSQPLITGVMVVDGAIPIGRGQRELVIGDRNTGKTALALDCVVGQRTTDVICVYVLIGQPASRTLQVRRELAQHGMTDRSVVIAAEASEPAALQYLAPYGGATIAEAFRDAGRDVLIVYDDLTKHADAYRALALLLERPPGREAFPGDIFYIHAELLERACARRAELGGGTITAIPIVETTDSDLSGYIPTNLISITDGQIYLDPARHERNERPAVDVGRSVSRIGSRAQPASIRSAVKNLRILISRFEELEALARVGLEVDGSTARSIRRGRVIRQLMCQQRFAPRSVAEQALTLTAVSNGWLDDAPVEQVRGLVDHALGRLQHPAAALASETDPTFDDATLAQFKVAVEDSLTETAS